MNKRPFFTILSASLNSASTIGDTLKSARSQSFQDFEHIVVDGASTDKTVEILKEFEHTYNLIWISEPDRGIADALNKALKRASGKYILVLQADDCLIGRTILEKMYHLLKNEKHDIYSFPVVKNYHGSKNVLLKPIRIKWWNHFKFIFFHQGAFVHKRVYEKVGKFRTEFSIAMDYDFFYRALKEKPVIAFGNFPVAKMSGSGISSSTEHLETRLSEEALVQEKNEANYLWRSAQCVFRFLYRPYKLGFK